jgi:hypothetical protein
MAADRSGNFFMANSSGNNVQEYAPGATAPTALLTGVSGPIACCAANATLASTS